MSNILHGNGLSTPFSTNPSSPLVNSWLMKQHVTANLDCTSQRAGHERRLTINSFIHDKRVPANVAINVTRLIVGGQGLRAGDPRITPEATAENCCIFCLENGRAVPETLGRLICNCPAVSHLRFDQQLAEVLPKLEPGFSIHRSAWSWSQMRAMLIFSIIL